MSSKERIVPYECSECSEKFYSYKNYKNHMTDHLISSEEIDHRVVLQNVYQCTTCAREFRDKSLLTKHYNAEHAKCAMNTKSERKQSLRSPLKVGVIDPVGYGAVETKREHRAVDVSYRRSSYDYEHRNGSVSSTVAAPQNSCAECNREFLNPDHLENHMSKFKNKKLYTCTYCDKRFHFRTSWKRHEECHKSERQVWQCDSCTMTFTQKVNLKRHKEGNKNPCGSNNRLTTMRMYSSRTALHCLKPTPSSLSRYGHSDDEEELDEEEDEEDLEEERGDPKPSSPEPSSTSIDNTHIQKGEAFYACSICGKLFTYRSLWSRHEKEHHSSSRFDCNLCGTKFTRQYYLVRHKKVCLSRVNTQSNNSHRVKPYEGPQIVRPANTIF